jgi:hypothetical protein
MTTRRAAMILTTLLLLTPGLSQAQSAADDLQEYKDEARAQRGRIDEALQAVSDKVDSYKGEPGARCRAQSERHARSLARKAWRAHAKLDAMKSIAASEDHEAADALYTVMLDVEGKLIFYTKLGVSMCTTTWSTKDGETRKTFKDVKEMVDQTVVNEPYRPDYAMQYFEDSVVSSRGAAAATLKQAPARPRADAISVAAPDDLAHRKSALEACYDEAAGAKPGVIVLKVEAGPKGRVKGAEVTEDTVGAGVATCLIDRVKRVRFPESLERPRTFSRRFVFERADAAADTPASTP